MIPLVAIIGLPNTGKSTFFNKVLSQRKALTHHEAGTTRDRAYGLVNWNGFSFFLIDTAGISGKAGSELEKNIQKQTKIALAEADLIIVMVDGKTNPGSEDFALAQNLTRTDKPRLLAVNKIETRNDKTQSAVEAYQKLGLGKPFPVSSINGSGMGDLLDVIVQTLKQRYPALTADYSGRLKLALVGKPNVGKSSLINSLLKQERLIVDKQAGTTRSTVEIPFEYQGHEFLLLDTAGIKKKWKDALEVETVATLQALRAVAATDVAMFILDASQPLTVQDQAIAAEIVEHNKAAVVVLNKIDLVDEATRNQILDSLPDHFSKLWYAPVVFTSALSGEGLPRMLELAHEIWGKGGAEIPQGHLDDFLDDIIKKHMPGKMEDERKPKIYNLKQDRSHPPTFKLTVNFPSAFAPAWKKIFEKQFRIKFGFEGSPIIINYARRT
jgi:GTP-binding protein